jgi:hypothetical protein
MSDDNVVQLIQPRSFNDPLTPPYVRDPAALRAALPKSRSADPDPLPERRLDRRF